MADELYDTAISFLGRPSLDLRTLDALHLACCARHRLELPTADLELGKSARALGIAVREL
jgi:predicted nucleic acid-binding protein